MKDFPALLLERRELLGLTQAQLAERSGLSENTIFSYEKGLRKPSAKSLFALCEALYVKITYFQPESNKKAESSQV